MSSTQQAQQFIPAQRFVRFSLESGVLRFGEFRTKAGRLSPYFYNAGLFNDGSRIGTLASFYAQRILHAELAEGLCFDMLFGPAYKGITLAATTAMALAQSGRNVPFAFNRKEAKDHGEGGSLIGAPLAGRVVIVDDVISAGTSVRESVELIRAHGAAPAAVVIGLDRMELGGTAEAPSEQSAVEQVRSEFGIPVFAIATLEDVLAFLDAEVTRTPAQADHSRRDHADSGGSTEGGGDGGGTADRGASGDGMADRGASGGDMVGSGEAATASAAVHLQRITDYRARYGVGGRR